MKWMLFQLLWLVNPAWCISDIVTIAYGDQDLQSSYLTVDQHLLNEQDTIEPLDNTQLDGYRGIWFELGQKYEYGDKYSGGLGTYTAKHVPLAVYAPAVDRTFFVYGGTTSDTSRYLLCMIGVYDHETGMLSRPTVVCDKGGVNDPHDNPSLMLDDEGYVWVFVSGRGRKRPGFKYRSREPYSIEHFDRISSEEMTYPQPWNTAKGYLHLFTKYTGVRQLYFERSKDGEHWSEDRLLSAIPQEDGERSGHYQISATWNGQKTGTFFNRHPQGNVDRRTDLYYLQTDDLGHSWTTVSGKTLSIPLEFRNSPARVRDFYSEEKNVYLKDMGFTAEGFPVGLFIKSNGHEPGPENGPYEWFVTWWDGHQWKFSTVTASDHNYDMGSIYISDEVWKIVGPTSNESDSPQPWGVGGQLEVWESRDRGLNWTKSKVLTPGSKYNHGYVRRPLNYQPPFCFFWADGHPHEFGPSRLYFGDFEGRLWKMPVDMTSAWQAPERVK